MDTLKLFEESLLYFYEEVRVNTYKNWIFDDSSDCNVEKMAEAGFIFVGDEDERDAVKCFFCNKHLDGWESTDNPWKEHLKHAPNCSFAKLETSQNNITLDQALKLRRDYLINILNAHFNDIDNELTNTLKKAKVQIKKS
ncbi:baculoviral IAP repeat-containing protein 5-like [Diorhabda sublineata]|uniref:baculoviral IAP repeat-containing protein 5-like n=1 Tax=Diorhabda sublineata TaxID=1163346 RepID=UPI0024E1715A|nr:baculoviral IAP repeat-containing protein 5-like [Diorhabda sublineata]